MGRRARLGLVGGVVQRGLLHEQPAPLREQRKFTNSIKLIWPVQPFAQKYSAFVFPKIVIDCPHSAPT